MSMYKVGAHFRYCPEIIMFQRQRLLETGEGYPMSVSRSPGKIGGQGTIIPDNSTTWAMGVLR